MGRDGGYETGVVLVERKGEGIAEMCFGGSSGRSC